MGETRRVRERPVGYLAAQRIDDAKMHLAEIIREARKVVTAPMGGEERFMRLGRILDESYQALQSLEQISKANEQ